MSHDIFLSYKREDRPRAAEIAAHFTQAGFSVFYDPQIDVGDLWDRTIEREIKAAKAVVVLWSTLSVESNWVRLEARYGVQRGIIAPAQISSCDIPLEFSSHEAANIADWCASDESHPEMQRLLTRVSSLVRPTTSVKPDSRVAAPPSSTTLQSNLLLFAERRPWIEARLELADREAVLREFAEGRGDIAISFVGRNAGRTPAMNVDVHLGWDEAFEGFFVQEHERQMRNLWHHVREVRFRDRRTLFPSNDNAFIGGAMLNIGDFIASIKEDGVWELNVPGFVMYDSVADTQHWTPCLSTLTIWHTSGDWDVAIARSRDNPSPA